jgi:hypothetical protein
MIRPHPQTEETPCPTVLMRLRRTKRTRRYPETEVLSRGDGIAR